MNSSIPRPEHPRPDFHRPSWMNLNGDWDFAFDDTDTGFARGWQRDPAALDRTICVPFCYQSALSGIGDPSRHDVMWYHRRFALSSGMAGRTVLLRFGAVDYSCDVFVNGERAGRHEDGYTPFSFEITDLLRDGENDLTVRVADLPDCWQPRGKQNWKERPFACWYTPTSGIWQSVWLEAAGETHLVSAQVTPDIDRGVATLELTLSRRPPAPVRADFVLATCGRVVRRLSAELTERMQSVHFDMVEGDRIEGFSLWEPGSPELYNLSIDLPGLDHVDTYFGMRKVEVKDGWVLLNNRPLYQRLVLDQGYWPGSLLTPPSDDAIREDVLWAQKLGFNGARKHQKLEDPRYYYWADKLGLLVWGEVPSAYAFSCEAVARLSATLTGFIARDFNHPCIIAWVPLNESWGLDRIYADPRMQAAADMLYHQAKALDGTRLVSSNDGWEQMKTDLCALHDYADTGDKLKAHFRDRAQVETHACDRRMTYASGAAPTGKEAFLVTEYGGIAFEEGDSGTWGYHGKVGDAEAFFKRYQSVTDAIRDLPYCQGWCYTQLTDVQQETNGVLTGDRKPKVDPERFRRLTVNPEGRL